MNYQTIGRDKTCDLVLEDDTISRVHAHAELDESGHIWLSDQSSANGMFLNRNLTWNRMNRTSLCAGDRIRFGELEVPLDRLTAAWNGHASLRSTPVPPIATRMMTDESKDESVINRPVRNPTTGMIEDRPNEE